VKDQPKVASTASSWAERWDEAKAALKVCCWDYQMASQKAAHWAVCSVFHWVTLRVVVTAGRRVEHSAVWTVACLVDLKAVDSAA
jgi:hypothetical protein